MKHIIIIVLLLFVKTISAQQKSYDFYIDQIDSLTVVSMENKNGKLGEAVSKSIYTDFISDLRKSKLSVEEKLKLIHKTQLLYNQYDNFELYYLAQNLLNSILYASDEAMIREQIMDILIDKFLYTGRVCNCIGYETDYAENAKDRLKEFMAGKVSTLEYSIRVGTLERNLRSSQKTHEHQAEAQMKKEEGFDNELNAHLADSVMQKRAIEMANKEFSLPLLSINCIYKIGYFDSEFIPYLIDYHEKYKSDDEINMSCTYALAKLGLSDYLANVYEGNKYSLDNAKYLGHEEAYWHYINLNYLWNTGKKVACGGPITHYPKAILTLNFLDYYIKIPREKRVRIGTYEKYLQKNPIKDFKTFNPTDHIKHKAVKATLELYQWLQDNRGYLELK